MIEPKQFVTGGNAIFTVVSRKTGTRFTYRARQPKEDSPIFVSVLTGQDNENDYSFLGIIFNGESYRHGKRSHIGEDAPSSKAFKWVWSNIRNLPETVEFHHEGRCCCCGRKLTTPESIERGIGPECAKRL